MFANGTTRPLGMSALTTAFGDKSGPDMLRSSSSPRDPLRKILMNAAAGPCQPVGRRVLADEATSGSREPNRPAAEFDAVKRRAPALAGQDRKGAGQGAGGDDAADCERRIDRIAREQADEMAQRRQRAAAWSSHISKPISGLCVTWEQYR